MNRLGFTEILHHIRNTYGTSSPSPRAWAHDNNLHSLLPHLTFASTGAADQSYLTNLNNLYAQHLIRAWDFVNHCDQTQFLSRFPFPFHAWRGHRYILPHEVTWRFDGAFGGNGHGMKGYWEVAEWMAENGGEQVRSEFPSGYA